jgi:uroporphyrinogen decarboxylase
MRRFEPLPRDEVIKAVERRGPVRVPLCRAKWWGEGLVEQYGDRLRRFDDVPDDVVQVFIENPVDPARMGLSWDWRTDRGMDANIVIDDWSRLDEFIDKLIDPADNPDIAEAARQVEAARAAGRYVQVCWWYFFFEALWQLRGMENLLCDYYTDREHLARLYEAVCDLYCRTLRTIRDRCEPDAFWTSDDLGHQTGPMMSPEIFREQIYPYYKRVGGVLKDCGLHFWLHSCGDNAPLLEDLIAAGVDVFHPVQKHTMDERDTVNRFGGRITFLAGIDVQHTLQEKDPDGVREEVRFLIDTFDRPEGGMCMAAGNGIVAGTPIENIEAFLDEALTYGQQHREHVSHA